MVGRSSEFEDNPTAGPSHIRGLCGEPTLSDARFAAEQQPGLRKCAALRLLPHLPHATALALSSDQRTVSGTGWKRPLPDYPVVGDQLPDTLHLSGSTLLDLNVVAHQRLDRRGHHNPSRRRQAGHACREVGGQSVDVVLDLVQVHQPAVHAHTNVDLDPEPTPGLFTDPSDVGDDVHTRQHRSARIVLWATGCPKTASMPSPAVPLICPS